MQDNIPKFSRNSFLFIRHGETAWNKEGRIQGQLDIELNETGKRQAIEAQENLSGYEVSYIVTSPLLRAKETALKISEVHPVPFSEEILLQEAMFGVAQGQGRQGWAADWRAGTFCPEGAESFFDFTARVLKGIERSLAIASKNDGSPLIVAHGGVFWAICKGLGIDAGAHIPNATPVRIYVQDNEWQVEHLIEWPGVVGGMM